MVNAGRSEATLVAFPLTSSVELNDILLPYFFQTERPAAGPVGPVGGASVRAVQGPRTLPIIRVSNSCPHCAEAEPCRVVARCAHRGIRLARALEVNAGDMMGLGGAE